MKQYLIVKFIVQIRYCFVCSSVLYRHKKAHVDRVSGYIVKTRRMGGTLYLSLKPHSLMDMRFHVRNLRMD